MNASEKTFGICLLVWVCIVRNEQPHEPIAPKSAANVYFLLKRTYRPPHIWQANSHCVVHLHFIVCYFLPKQLHIKNDRKTCICVYQGYLVLMEFTRTNTKPDGEIRQTYKQISLLYFRIHLHKFKVNFNSSGWRACKCKWRLFTFYLHLDRIICGQIHAKIHTIFSHKYTHFTLHWKMNWTSWKFDLTHKNTYGTFQ